MALLLVIIAVVISATVAYSYIGSQGTSIGIARNIRDQAAARYVAETGLELAVAYILATSDWRTEKTSGVWVTGQGFGPGSFSIRCDDGVDADGDGMIGPGEGDGDLADDPNDPATVTVTGQVNRATHVVRAVIRSGSSDFGYKSPLSSSANDIAGRQIATRVSLEQAGTLASISLYASGPPPMAYRLAIYTDVNGEPGSLLAQTDAAGIGLNVPPSPPGPPSGPPPPPAGADTPAWRTLPASPSISLEPGDYWLAFCFEHRNMDYFYNSTGGQTRIKNHDAIPGGFTSSWGASDSSNTRQISIRATCTSGANSIDWQN